MNEKGANRNRFPSRVYNMELGHTLYNVKIKMTFKLDAQVVIVVNYFSYRENGSVSGLGVFDGFFFN